MTHSTHSESQCTSLRACEAKLTVYSARNSVSMRLRRRSSHDRWNAVEMGSFELSAISELDESALYALMRDCEWRSESCSLEVTHSSQPHLPERVEWNSVTALLPKLTNARAVGVRGQ